MLKRKRGNQKNGIKRENVTLSRTKNKNIVLHKFNLIKFWLSTEKNPLYLFMSRKNTEQREKQMAKTEENLGIKTFTS